MMYMIVWIIMVMAIGHDTWMKTMTQIRKCLHSTYYLCLLSCPADHLLQVIGVHIQSMHVSEKLVKLVFSPAFETFGYNCLGCFHKQVFDGATLVLLLLLAAADTAPCQFWFNFQSFQLSNVVFIQEQCDVLLVGGDSAEMTCCCHHIPEQTP